MQDGATLLFNTLHERLEAKEKRRHARDAMSIARLEMKQLKNAAKKHYMESRQRAHMKLLYRRKHLLLMSMRVLL